MATDLLLHHQCYEIRGKFFIDKIHINFENDSEFKGHSQQRHMSIRYHFIANLHTTETRQILFLTRYVKKKEWGKGHSQKRFSANDWKSSRTLRKLEQISRWTLIFITSTHWVWTVLYFLELEEVILLIDATTKLINHYNYYSMHFFVTYK